MNKLRLDLEEVEVESFPTAPKAVVKGTVDGHLRSRVGDTWCITCFQESCYCTADNDSCTCP